jgi:hypothetical protein
LTQRRGAPVQVPSIHEDGSKANELVKPVSVIASHANGVGTASGKVRPGSKTDAFVKASPAAEASASAGLRQACSFASRCRSNSMPCPARLGASAKPSCISSGCAM